MMNFRRIAAVALIVLLSIALPMSVVGWSIHAAIWGKPWGRPSLEWKIFQGFVKNGEFWYLVGTLAGNARSARVTWQIRRLDLQTGVERNSELKLANDFQIPFLVNGEIYGSGDAISKVVGEHFIKIADWPISAQNPSLYSYLFVDNGRLTMVAETNDSEFKLLQLIDNQWVEGRKIRLPAAGSEWKIDPEEGYRINIPEAYRQTKFDGGRDHVWVSIQGEQVHVLVTYDNRFAAYRNGFEFVDDDQDVASALGPANVAPTSTHHDLTGWEPIQPIRADDRWSEMRSDRDGVLVAGWHQSARVVRRTNSGNWVDLDGLPEPDHAGRSVLVDLADSTTYVLDSDETWNSAVIYKVDGNRVQAPHVILPGCYDEYFRHWLRCFAGIFLAWLLHLVLLVGGVAWFTRGLHFSDYSFGSVQVTLASTPRRALACFVDLLLMLTSVVLLTKVQCDLFGVMLNPPSREEFCRWMFEYDWRVYQSGFSLDNLSNYNNMQPPLETFLLSIGRHDSLFTAAILEFLLLIGLRSYVEGRFGITPGKWLLGIRTVRTSLRPCGFARALVRSVLYWIDIPLLATPIPAAISMMFSRHRQRLGDRVADTVVVMASST